MSVDRLLNPRSVAIVGASDRVGPGLNAWLALQNVGFEGEAYLVNPNRPELFDRPTVPSLAEIPGMVDAVFIAIQQERVVDTVRDAIDKGGRPRRPAPRTRRCDLRSRVAGDAPPPPSRSDRRRLRPGPLTALPSPVPGPPAPKCR